MRFLRPYGDIRPTRPSPLRYHQPKGSKAALRSTNADTDGASLTLYRPEPSVAPKSSTSTDASADSTSLLTTFPDNRKTPGVDHSAEDTEAFEIFAMVRIMDGA